MLSLFTLNGMPDPVFIYESWNCTPEGCKGCARWGACESLFSEMYTSPLCKGDAEADCDGKTRQIKKLVKAYAVDILCGYSASPDGMDSHIFQRICAEHSAVCIV